MAPGAAGGPVLTGRWEGHWLQLCLGLSVFTYVTYATTTINANEQQEKIIVHPREQKVTDHAIATFNCDTYLIPVPPIYWRRNGRRLTNQGAYKIFRTWTGSVLRVEPVRAKRDDARFECVMEYGDHEPLVAAANLRVYPKGHFPEGYPRVLEHPTLRVLEEDTVCILACTPLGEPPPKVRWLKDYIPLDMLSYRYSIMPDGDLQIGYIQDSDDGTYECIAENDLGVAYSNPARLIVEEYQWP